MLIVGSIVIRVDDLDAQIAFWTRALDYEVREPRDVDFAVLRPRSGSGPNVSLDAVPAPRALPPKIHLDLYAEDQAGEVARLSALGARVVPWDRMPDDADFVIMEDPEGVRFCVIDAADWSGWAAR
jgi:catechol 2,3-dioxygenase-like lactoylglutathione lyase family enzyme